MRKAAISIGLILGLLSACDDEKDASQSSGSSDPNATPSQSAVGCPPSTPLGSASYSSNSQAKIDTDGDPNERGKDVNWQAQTSGGVNSATTPFIVMSPTQMSQDGVRLGDWAHVTNNQTGAATWARVEDRGPSGNSGEISEAAATSVGIQFTSNSFTVGNPSVSINAWGGTSAIQANCSGNVASN